MSDFRKQLAEQAKKSAEENLKNHRVRQKHRDGDTVRLWRCDNNGSSVYHFTVCAPPGWLIVYGDMGECMWSREPDMINFARKSINSLGYFSEKASRDSKIDEQRGELITEFLAEYEAEHLRSYGDEMTAEQLEVLSELRDSWDGSEDIEGWLREFYESDLCNDCESMPDVKSYTYHYLWKIEALKWFLAKLDAGDVVVDPYDWSKQK